jgi:hypothetical protein
VHVVTPPYALATPAFPLRALAALAARAPLGGEREVALACFVAGRLGLALLPPATLTAELRQARATGARLWFASLTLPASTRIPFARVVDTSADCAETANIGFADALETLLDAVSQYLEPASRAELAAVALALRESRPALEPEVGSVVRRP